MELAGDRLLSGLAVGGRGGLAHGVEADAGVAFGVDVVEGRPVLPALAVGEGLLVDDPGADLALAARSQADLLHQLGDQQAALLGDRGALGGGEQAFGDAVQTGVRLVVQAVEVDLRALGEFADELGVVQEDQFLDVGDRALGCASGELPEGVFEQGGEILRLASGQQQRGVLGAVAGAHPDVVVAGQDPAVVLELDQIQGVAGQDQQVHLMPAAPVVAELEIGPGPERGCVG